MKSKLRALTVLAFLISPISAFAVPIPSLIGEWRGDVVDTSASNGVLNTGLADIFFLTQNADGTGIGGTLSVVCLSNTDCGTNGIVSFSGGTLIDNILSVAFGDPSNFSEFSGPLSEDANTISGHYFAQDQSGTVTGDFNLSRVVSVPEPGSVGLVLLGFAGIALSRRKRGN
ncbi:MAG TPA: PEP-CTERM sorting domain-containing protein [Steroidobacteraceae bacterium]|nr:PEP-CTERM sorting domain-containing protein [Steroidobacteraceae bacterium]